MKFPDHTLEVNVATNCIAWLTFVFNTTNKAERPITLARVSDEIGKWMEENRPTEFVQEMKFEYPTMEDEDLGEPLGEDAVPDSNATITPNTERGIVNLSW